MFDQKNDINEPISFWELLTENEIIIPKIQRDFAQGREDKKIEIIRDDILRKLESILSNDTNKLSLDFVYGSNENNKIIPLDGQQRLTTLFLLHLYLAKISGNCDEENKKIFKKFQYEIRSTTQKFINALIENELNEDIENQSWFFNSWKKDPTVKGMLVMLSAISKIFIGKTNFWNILTNDEKITFYFLPLEKFKLTDELYVKMNSRGKSLSDFENFKAWLDEKLSTKTNSTFNKVDWSLKLDTTWTDLFWNTDNGDFSIDNEMMSFFKGIALFNYVENREEIKVDSEKKEFQNTITILNDAKSYISNQDFEKFYFIEKGNTAVFECITLFLDNYIKNREVILNGITFWGNDVDVFKRFIQDATFVNKTLFYGLYQFVIKTENLNEENFINFIRILRNLVENTTIGNENFKNILNSTKELASSEDIFIEIEKIELTGFDGNQIKEEKLKVSLIRDNNDSSDWRSQIFKIENDIFLKGKINFLLEFSKVDGSYNFESFQMLSNSFLYLFEVKDDLLRRALLTFGNYTIWDGYSTNLGAHRYSLLKSNEEWKSAFNYHKPFLIVVKSLLDMTDLNTERSIFLNEIIAKTPYFNDWRDMLIKDEKHLNFCENKRICLRDESTKTILFILRNIQQATEGSYKKHSISKIIQS